MNDPFDLPSAAELVEAVREYLESAVLPNTEGRIAFHARVAINVLATVQRELEGGPELVEAQRARLHRLGFASDAELSAAIRSGSLDDRWDQVAAEVRAAVAERLRVANPRYLAQT